MELEMVADMNVDKVADMLAHLLSFASLLFSTS